MDKSAREESEEKKKRNDGYNGFLPSGCNKSRTRDKRDRKKAEHGKETQGLVAET